MKLGNYRKVSLAMLASVSAIAMTAGPVYAAGVERSFNIPSQPAKTSLQVFAKQSGMQVLANSADLNGIVTNDVNGTFAPEEALQRLINGSGLAMRVNANGVALIVNAQAQAATGTPAAATVAATPPADDTIVVVTGFKKSYADAVRMKRNAVGITDSISSDGLGRFPDLNVGEAVQRIPGVQINREAGSRDATINLRGLPGTYARTTINGLAFAEPILDSSTPLGAFNADIFSAISIIKSPSAADQSGGLSGNIDLQIAPALSRKDGGFFKIANEYNTLGKLSSPSITLGYNKHLSHDLAVFGVIAYKQEKFRRDSVNYPQYTVMNAATTPNFSRFVDYYAPAASPCPAGQACATGGTGNITKAGILFPSDIRQVVKYNSGTLLSAASGVEWKPDDHTKLGLNGFYTQRDLSKNYTDIIDIDMRDATTVIDPQSAPFKLADGNYYINKYNFSNTRVFDSFRSEPLVEKTWSLNGTFDWRNDKWRNATIITASQAENHGYQVQIDIRNVAKAAGNGTSGSFYSGADDIDTMSFTLSPSPAVTVPAGTWTWGGTGNPPTLINSVTGDQAIVAGSDGRLTNTLRSVQTDFERFLSAGLITSVQFGGRVEDLKFKSMGDRAGAQGVQSANINSSFLVPSAFANNFAGGQAGSYLTNWQTVDINYAISHLQPVTVPAGYSLTATGFVNDPTNGSYISNNFTNESKTNSVYVMGKFSGESEGVAIRGNFGVRYEQTSNIITSLDRTSSTTNPPTFTTNVYRHNYSEFLPSFLLAADLRDDLVLRFAAYRTLVRPQPRNVTPTTQVSGSGLAYTVVLGNVNLKPYTANSYDVSLEWYNRPNGLIAFDVYQKDVKGIITSLTGIDNLCPADATQWGLGHLHVNGTACISDIAGNPTVTISGNTNNPNVLKAQGEEFTIQQNLDFLPGFWKNFGGEINYSHTTLKGLNSDGSRAVLPGVSKNNYNLIGYYETKTFGVRLVYDYRDEYTLAGGNTFTGGPSLVAKRGQLDASASYNINDQFSISIDGYNLTNAIRTQYQNEPLMPRANDFDGRTFTISLHGTF
ncbi:MAG TPA: TonB-dependent receptor [Asticcacaulis sp.]|nr:TonB-dependent receptor [Asticcacaulis sp.]